MADKSRQYTSRRLAIVEALAEKFKEINGTSPFLSDLENRVFPRIKFWDEVDDFPTIHVNGGMESRVYQGDQYKDRFLSCTIRAYVNNEDDSVAELEALLEDIETVLEDNSRLTYRDRLGTTQSTQQITIISIDTDEGVLDPLGAGEIVCEIRY